MAGIRCTDLQARPTEFLDCTSLTLDEFQQLAPPFEAASKPIWWHGASLANPGLPASFACRRIAPCRRRKSVCFSFSPP
jgi:hypothetical protein